MKLSIPKPVYVQESDLVIGIETSTLFLLLYSTLSPIIKDLHLHIALMEGIRKYTQHPISNLISSDKLSPSHQAFPTQLNPIKNPPTI